MANKKDRNIDIGKEIRELKYAIKLFLEEGREHRAQAEKDRKRAEEDRKHAEEDRKRAEEDRKRADERFEEYVRQAEEDRREFRRKAERDWKITMALIKNLTRELTREGRKITERLTGIENILRRMSNGLQGNR